MKSKNQMTKVTLPDYWRLADPEPGEWHKYGYGVRRDSKLASDREYWTQATRYVVRVRPKDAAQQPMTEHGQPPRYRIVALEPGRYYISTHGRIYDAKRDALMRYSKQSRSHQQLHTADGKTIMIRSYRLVLDNFLTVQPQYEHLIFNYCLTANHLDRKPWRDFLTNVEYTTQAENMRHMWSLINASRDDE